MNESFCSNAFSWMIAYFRFLDRKLSAMSVYFTCGPICYSVIISEIIIILFILSLLPNISSSVIKLPIIIITDYTITDHTATDWSYYFSVLIPKVLLPILTITICLYPELFVCLFVYCVAQTVTNVNRMWLDWQWINELSRYSLKIGRRRRAWIDGCCLKEAIESKCRVMWSSRKKLAIE